MNLETRYLGLRLRNPLVVGSAPFCDDVELAKRLQDAGAAALIMRSLFAEQIDPRLGKGKSKRKLEQSEVAPEYPEIADYQLSPEQYLRQVERLKKSIEIPLIASLNGRRDGEWTDFAPRLESAGADAIELNCYQVVTDPALTSHEVESSIFGALRGVAVCVRIPVSVKLSPFHTALAQMAESLELAGAAGIVIFNRFYQPDVNTKAIGIQSKLHLSHSSELLLRLRWLAILSPIVRGSLAATGGVHTADDAIKSLLCGADVVQVVSVLVRQGPPALAALLAGLESWMKEHGFDRIDQFQARLDLRQATDPAAIERANYLKLLQSFRMER